MSKVAILDNDGSEVVRYKYDTWGKLLEIGGSLANTVGRKNPYRYRGYRYDNETGLYYLQSRYYNPEMGRFINADAVLGASGSMIAYNLFAYCNNNPVNLKDPSGFMAVEATIAVTNCYNPVGWFFAALFVVEIIVVVVIAVEVYEDGNLARELPWQNEDNPPAPITPISPPVNLRPDIGIGRNPQPQQDDDERRDGVYWSAWIGKGGRIETGRSLTTIETLDRIYAGKSVMCIDGWAALDLIAYIIDDDGGNWIYEIDKGKENTPGYYYHFHPFGGHGNPHIWHYGPPVL